MTASMTSALRGQLPYHLKEFANDLAHLGVTKATTDGRTVHLEFADHVKRAAAFDATRPEVQGYRLAISGPMDPDRIRDVSATVSGLPGVTGVSSQVDMSFGDGQVKRAVSMVVHTNTTNTSARLAQLLPPRWGEGMDAGATYVDKYGQHVLADGWAIRKG